MGIETRAEPLVHGLREGAEDGGEPRLVDSRGAHIVRSNSSCKVMRAESAKKKSRNFAGLFVHNLFFLQIQLLNHIRSAVMIKAPLIFTT